jgi:hypothetical protein
MRHINQDTLHLCLYALAALFLIAVLVCRLKGADAQNNKDKQDGNTQILQDH